MLACTQPAAPPIHDNSGQCRRTLGNASMFARIGRNGNGAGGGGGVGTRVAARRRKAGSDDVEDLCSGSHDRFSYQGINYCWISRELAETSTALRDVSCHLQMPVEPSSLHKVQIRAACSRCAEFACMHTACTTARRQGINEERLLQRGSLASSLNWPPMFQPQVEA